MRKAILVASFILFMPPLVMAAGFERDLFYGMVKNQEVRTLQGFLQEQGFYSGPLNGNFFALTRAAVKKFQEREGIKPALGYFGAKTRGTANKVTAPKSAVPEAPSKTSAFESIQSQIQALQKQLAALQAKQAALQVSPAVPVLPQTTPATSSPATSTPAAVPIASASASPAATATAPAPAPAALEISANQTLAAFPEVTAVSLKLGEITIRSGLASPILFSQMVLDLLDGMNSPANRGKKVYFILRSGTTTLGDIISSNEFQFNSHVPDPANPFLAQLRLVFPVLFASGETKTLSLWVDNFDYVFGGSLTLRFSSLPATSAISPVGGFSFALTK